MKEKVLFFDIDGTLVDNTYGVYDVPEGVKRELKRIQNDGHKLLICSGRPKAMINQQFLDLGFDFSIYCYLYRPRSFCKY